jgi:hypothetical protein
MSWQIQFFIFETNLGYESEDQAGAFDEKTVVKNLVQVYLQDNNVAYPVPWDAHYK